MEKLQQLEEKEDKVDDLDQIKKPEHLPHINQRKSEINTKKDTNFERFRTVDQSRSKSENTMPDDGGK